MRVVYATKIQVGDLRRRRTKLRQTSLGYIRNTEAIFDARGNICVFKKISADNRSDYLKGLTTSEESSCYASRQICGYGEGMGLSLERVRNLSVWICRGIGGW